MSVIPGHDLFYLRPRSATLDLEEERATRHAHAFHESIANPVFAEMRQDFLPENQVEGAIFEGNASRVAEREMRAHLAVSVVERVGARVDSRDPQTQSLQLDGEETLGTADFENSATTDESVVVADSLGGIAIATVVAIAPVAKPETRIVEIVEIERSIARRGGRNAGSADGVLPLTTRPRGVRMVEKIDDHWRPYPGSPRISSVWSVVAR